MTERKLEFGDQHFGIWAARHHEYDQFYKHGRPGVTSEPKAAEEVERETATQVESNSGLRKKL
jgi:hypothetical protein